LVKYLSFKQHFQAEDCKILKLNTALSLENATVFGKLDTGLKTAKCRLGIFHLSELSSIPAD
jgi:hypothetical protein